MMNTIEDYYYDIDALSSPTPDRPYETNNDFVCTLPSPNLADFFPFDSLLSGKPSAQPSPAKAFFENTNFDVIPKFSDLPPPPLPAPKPKRKVQRLVFQPFLSFDATEITVQALKDQLSQPSAI